MNLSDESVRVSDVRENLSDRRVDVSEGIVNVFEMSIVIIITIKRIKAV